MQVMMKARARGSLMGCSIDVSALVHLFVNVLLSLFLLLARYVPNVAKEEL